MRSGGSAHCAAPGSMVVHSSSRRGCSFKHMTIVMCAVNVVAILLVLQALLGPLFRQPQGHGSRESDNLTQRDIPPEQLKYIKEAEEIRRAMEPVDLIERVKQIQLESESLVEVQGKKEASQQKQASEISKRLKNLVASGDQNNQKDWTLELITQRSLSRCIHYWFIDRFCLRSLGTFVVLCNHPVRDI